jgi:hypothetical protein
LSSEGTLHIDWPLAGGRRWRLWAQLANHAGAIVAPAAADICVHANSASQEANDQPLPAWAVQVWLRSP